MDPVLYYYETNADRLCDLYEGTGFHEAQGMASDMLPGITTAVLDVGCGSGRDAAAMSRLGHDVTAVDMSRAMLKSASRWHPDAKVRWKHGRLPDMLPQGPYGFVLCSAVLMHLHAAEIEAAMSALARLMTPEGRLVIGLRQPAEHDPPGVYHPHDPEDIIGAAAAAGLLLLDHRPRRDVFSRTGIEWTAMAFARHQTKEGTRP